MSAITSPSQILHPAATLRAPRRAAIDAAPLFGRAITIRIALTPGTITLLAVPATILATMLTGWVLLTSLSIPVYAHEMFAGGIVNTFGGILAAVPLFLLMKHGAQAIARAALLGIAIRCACTLSALLLAMGPGWGLDRMALAYWALACYFPLLIVETSIIAWLAHKAQH